MMFQPKTVIIAEAGVNHNGSPERAGELVTAAAEAGADFVKFQTFKADALVVSSAQKADYQQKATGRSESQYQMLKSLELDHRAHLALMQHCRDNEIGFLSTPFDNESISFLAGLNLKYFKIPSGEITNMPYLRHVGKYGKRVLLSTGMATLDEIRDALAVLNEAGTPSDRVVVLHCNTEYPTPMADVNLRAMLTIRDQLGVRVGYSDHTLGIEVPVAAVALGAEVIEKHLTLDRTMPGPDHHASLEPAEFRAMVVAIRNIEKAMGDGVKKPSRSEIKNKTVARKSIVAACPIEKGDVFTTDNLAVKRPGTGISPMLYDKMLGTVSNRAYCPDDLIEPSGGKLQ